MKNVAVIPFLDKDKGSIPSIELEVLGVPIYHLALSSVIQCGMFDKVFIITDISQVDFNNLELANYQVFASSSDVELGAVQVRSSILEIIKENELESDDWLTLINPAFPFQNIDYFKTLQATIWTEKFDYIYPRVELVDQFFGIAVPKEIGLANDRNCLHKVSGLFKSIKVCRTSDLKRLSTDSVGYLDVTSSDDVEIRDVKDIRTSYPRLHDIIIARRKNYTERVVTGNELDYFDVKTDPDGVARDFLSEVQGRLDFAENEIKEVQKYLCTILSSGRIDILDIGCGTGVISGEFKQTNVLTTGIEPSPIACDLAENRLDRVLCGGYEKFTNEFDDASYDVIIAFHVIEHVQDPNNLLDEISRLLKPGGFAVISTPDFEGPLAKKYGNNFRLYNDPTHISLFGMAGLIKSIEVRNLSVVKIDQPFLETKYFTQENVMRLFTDQKMSPPFTGNVVSIFVTK